MFEMRDDGLVEVLDASARFVGEATRAPGSVVLCAMEGSRPLLVEVQRSSPPRARAPAACGHGLDRNRVALVLAVLGRHAGIGLGAATCSSTSSGRQGGGARVDLAVALAVASAAKRTTLRGSDGHARWPASASSG